MADKTLCGEIYLCLLTAVNTFKHVHTDKMINILGMNIYIDNYIKYSCIIYISIMTLCQQIAHEILESLCSHVAYTFVSILCSLDEIEYEARCFNVE